MKLASVEISNYRSINRISFAIDALEDKSLSFGLIGVNEAGKSSILKALALKEGLVSISPKDFADKDHLVEIVYFYQPEKDEIDQLRLQASAQLPEADTSALDFSEVILKSIVDIQDVDQRPCMVEFPKLSVEIKQAVTENLKQSVIELAHRAVFWTAEDRFLISQPINFESFSNDPDSVSIPLKNCFSLAGIKGKEAIAASLRSSNSDSTEREALQEKLGEVVTRHINSAWPNHKVRITFNISDGHINFHIRDESVPGKAKTSDQRSDGFKQFVSFLLTVSAQNSNGELTNTILLLDEPETHLHPQAQEDLLKELIRITQSGRNNIVFFATHSNHMIDKDDLSRNFQIIKNDAGTEKIRFDKKNSTYASVTYEVFGIPNIEYHNELYDQLRENYSVSIGKDVDAVGILGFDDGYLKQIKKLPKNYACKGKRNSVTLPTYVRNAIHYPANRGKDFITKLQESTVLLRSYE